MVFNDSTNKQGLIQDIDFWLFGSSAVQNAAFSIADRTRRINRRLDEVVSIIFQNDNRWRYDDFNQSDMNIFYTTLVANQNDYEISGADFLSIEEVAVLNAQGKYIILESIIREPSNAQRLQALEDGDSGMPTCYEKHGNSIILYPKPSLTFLTAALGLMVRGKRLPSYFVVGDTTKTPGFNPLYHEYLSKGASYDYALSHGMKAKATQLKPDLDKLEIQIGESYATRAEDSQPNMQLEGANEYHDDLY